MSSKTIYILLALFLVLITVPFLVAWRAVDAQHVFGGFLLNPIDGNSYLAKMYIGYSGGWRFQLPYTTQPGQGAYLFLFYIFLGHLTHFLHLPILWGFHLARIIFSAVLFISMMRLIRLVFPEDKRKALFASILVLFGSGLGWLLVPFGQMTMDMWVAEAYPFLSSYSNPHFPLGLALVLEIFMLSMQLKTGRQAILLFLAGLLLSLVLPFGIILVAMVLLGMMIWRRAEEKTWQWKPLALILGGGGSFTIYQYWATLQDPILSGWNLQNITPAPAAWDLVISLLPALLLAVAAIVFLIRKHIPLPQKYLVVWSLSAVVLIYFPFNLQRRFALGIFIPVAILGVMGLTSLVKTRRRVTNAFVMVMGLSLLTNLLLMPSGVLAAQANHSLMVTSQDEQQALAWIRSNTSAQAVILASPEFSLFIPAYTGRRVVYGHPFETIDADMNEQRVVHFYSGVWDEEETTNFIAQFQVCYIVLGPREQAIGNPAYLQQASLKYESNDLRIYQPIDLPSVCS